MRFTSLFGALILICASPIDAVHFRGSVNTRFNYDDEDNQIGINHWNDLDQTCRGRFQSPINIDTRIAHRGHFSHTLKFHNLNSSVMDVEVENSGTTADFNMKFRGDRPEISDGPLNSTYVFESFHYHWGILDEEGSEHTVNNRQYGMEGHYVFYNKKYRSEANAGQYTDGFVVVSLLYEIHSRGPKLPIFDMVDHVVYDGEKQNIRHPKLTLAKLIPESFIYAHYRGSFTTPPCMENVDWIVALDIQKIHPNQMKSFRTMVAEKKVPIADNFRPLQAINGRRIQLGMKLKDEIFQEPEDYGNYDGPLGVFNNKDTFAFPNVRDPDQRVPTFYG